jgi:putative FmdB family regulatory protein
MPLYEYECKTCKTYVEKLQGFNAKAPNCEKCEEKMRRKISQSSFALKGGGWYKDGYTKGNEK